jgi:hypothetical protein
MIFDRSKGDRNRVLYKYSSAEGAFRILNDLRVKCTSPLSFNDPFDTITEIRADFELDEFPHAFLDRIYMLINQEEEPDFEVESEFSEIIRKIRKRENRKVGKPILEPIRHLLNPIVSEMKSIIEADNREWYSFLTTWRIFCLSEVYDNLLMWGHYCERHKGAVIGFRCVPEIDSAFCAARPVTYSNRIPTLGSLGEWVDHTIGVKRIGLNPEELFIRMTYTKSIDWQYEKEWRYALPQIEGVVGDFDLREILPQEIHSIYMGCRMEVSYRKRIIDLLSTKLKHVLLYQAARSKSEFKLDFERVY